MLTKKTNHDDYWEWQFKSSERLFRLYPKLELEGKSVLDLGCGIGGRSAYLASTKAEKVVAVDINHEEIDIANTLKNKLPDDTKRKLEYIKTSETDVGSIGKFDIVFSIDSLEHVEDPLSFLNLAYQYTKPGGVCYFGTFGWYHWMGSHMMILGIPFVNIFFSEKTILEANRKLLSQEYYIPSRFDSNPPVARWEGVNDLADRPGEHLNKITVRGMSDCINNSLFDSGELTVHGFQKSYMRPLNFLSKISKINEIYHSYCVGRLERKA